MPRYRFVHEIAEVFHDLIHGVVTVVRADNSIDLPGSTVVLNPGDEVKSKTELVHAHLEPVDAPAPKLPDTPEPAPDAAPVADVPADVEKDKK